VTTLIEGSTAYDEARAEAFANGLIEKFNHGAMTLMISIGHRTQLFDVMAELDWDTSDGIAQTMQWISVLGHVEDKIVDKFKHGGGVDYCEFHRFHEVMASESDHTVVNALSEQILPIVPELLDRLQNGLR
jgi:hypothetical protein